MRKRSGSTVTLHHSPFPIPPAALVQVTPTPPQSVCFAGPRFYIAAENQGICRALWCRRAGASRRRVSSLRVNAPVLRITTDIHAAAAAATATASVAVFPNKTAESTAAICRSIGKPRKPKQDEGLSHKGKIRQAAAVAATARALSLSAALNEGDQVIPVGGGGRGRPPLFRTAVDDPTRAWEAAWELGGNNANELDVGVDEELVNIAVVARCRPLLAREIKRGVREAVFCKGDQVIVSGEELPIHRSRRFVFDRVFGERKLLTCLRGMSQARCVPSGLVPTTCLVHYYCILPKSRLIGDIIVQHTIHYVVYSPQTFDAPA